MSYPKYTSPEICANCGSMGTSVDRIERSEFGTRIIVWRSCFECGCLFIDTYEHTAKGIPEEEA